MPKEITHIFFSEDTVNQLDKNKLFSTLSSNKPFYNFGSIAVDILYYNLDKFSTSWGDFLHGKDGNETSLPIIEALIDLKNNQNDKYFHQKLSFICGFLTHMALDITFHPFVYYFSGNYYDDNKDLAILAKMNHRIIEGWIDLFLLEKKSINLKDFKDLDNIYKNKEINLIILDFMSKIFDKAWKTDKNILKPLKRGYFIQKFLTKQFKNSNMNKLIRIINRLSNNKLKSYVALFYPIKYSKIPTKIIEFGQFKNPVTNEEYKGNFYTLWDDALKLSTAFLKAVNDFIYLESDENNLKSIIKDYSLDVGFVKTKVDEAKHFLPLSLDIE